MNHSNPRVEYPDLFKLSVDERLELVEELWDSIAADAAPEPESAAVVAILEERMAQYRADPASGISWEEARRLMRED
ncbi:MULTISPECIES: addiction module protein [unclassified Rhizobacter]|uniref:addiction module protein n=1 Tax=unclassified Rhizobacter TaxID=2640088 RepID=UPI0006FFD32D|nr:MULTISPECIES: addiction module protein [unclassified Rhizobacter]KQU81529.1 hypothetical protein ASC88_01235 [Rhizobacter sp. Root29]KQW12140.1 hypothetical protein ASC98_20335 [Rhizobacter sp. Root1238]KRB02955.1 hypothetical protein ASE08_15420 [Rhizobacter sp. Root16D2]